MKRLLLLTIAALCAALPLPARNWKTVSRSSEYICGEGWGSTLAEADRMALQDLISKISLYVTSEIIHEETADSVRFLSVVNTYSGATLTNTEKEILSPEPDARVGRWIKRSDVSRIFAARQAKVIEYVENAVRAESRGKVDVALKDLYWALALLRSLGEPGAVTWQPDEDAPAVHLLQWIPQRMAEILEAIDVRAVSRNGDEVEIAVTYKDLPAVSVDYTYFDGRDWANISTAKDGVGIMELSPGYSPAAGFQLRIEYEYAGEAQIDREVESVLPVVSATPMRGAYKTVTFRPARPASKNPETASFSSVDSRIFSLPEPYADADGSLSATLNRVVSALSTRNYAGAADCFTPDGLDVFNRLLRYGQASVVGTPSYRFYSMGSDIYARGLTMVFRFGGVRRTFTEDVVFTFNSRGLIDNIAFGLGKTAETDILGKGVWSREARLAIMDFLENYQTAYALKRLDYIRSVFDDDAVIITGRVVRPSSTSTPRGGDLHTVAGSDIIIYNRQDKNTFLRNLEASFASKEYINLRLADNEVRKLGKGGELYAIQISQEFYSSNYGDKGYLFLMVDINDPRNPVIKVRTWQPDKDPRFGIYGPEHFR